MSLLCIVASGLVLTSAPAEAQDELVLPTREDAQRLFSDKINQYTFTPNGFSGFLPSAAWSRTAQLIYSPDTPERPGHGLRVPAHRLAAERITLHGRTAPPTGVDSGVFQEIAGQPVNPFPVFFRLDEPPGSFVFYNSSSAAAESQQTCRPLRDLLACRVIHRQTGAVSYDVLERTEPVIPFGLPTVDTLGSRPGEAELLRLFADQRGRRTYPLTGVSAWTLQRHWRREAQIIFTIGQDERVDDPMVIDPIPKEIRLYQRTRGDRVEFGLIEWADRTELGEGELMNPFPQFSGDLDSWVFFNSFLLLNNDYEETCRPMAKDGNQFLICRTLWRDNGAFYQFYVPLRL